MSKAILVMDMPEDCIKCPLCNGNDDCVVQSQEANDAFCTWEALRKNCPLVPIQEELATDTNVGSNGWIPCSERLPEEPKENPFFEGKPLELYLVSMKHDKYPWRAFWNGKDFTDGWSIVQPEAWMPLPDPYKPEKTAGLDFSAGKEYNNFRENNNEEDNTMRDIMCLCEKHPEKAQIFSLVKMLTEAGYSFHFNFLEDLKPTPFGQEGNPETDIDWEKYHFLVEVGEPVEPGLSEISVCFNQEGDKKLLELLDMRTVKTGAIHRDLIAEESMEIIERLCKAE